MKIPIVLLLYFYFFICIFPSNIIVQANSDEEGSILIHSFEEDVTGDGFREELKLEGVLLSKDSNYYRDIWLNISSLFSKQWKISFSGGYNPSIQLIDFDHDYVFDLFYQISKDENEQKYDYQLYTLKNGTVKQISLPSHKYIQGKFLNNFQANIQMNPNSKPIIVDLSKNKTKYVEQGIFDKNGMLIKEREIIIEQISYLEPILISESKGYGLKSYQVIKGIDNDDILGTVETLWYFKNKEWIILKTKFVD